MCSEPLSVLDPTLRNKKTKHKGVVAVSDHGNVSNDICVEDFLHPVWRNARTMQPQSRRPNTTIGPRTACLVRMKRARARPKDGIRTCPAGRTVRLHCPGLSRGSLHVQKPDFLCSANGHASMRLPTNVSPLNGAHRNDSAPARQRRSTMYVSRSKCSRVGLSLLRFVSL